jgi:hypothetical protein
MSPAKKRGTTFATTAAVLVILSVLFVVFLVQLSSSGSVKSQLGSSTYLAGRARQYAPLIAAQGPFLLPDLLGKNRPLYLQHLGPDPKLGWIAIQATVPNEPPKCVIQWNQAEQRFHDPCSTVTYPPDGAGLIRYPATVLPSDRINVDLRTALPGTTTVTTGTVPPAP